MKTREKLARLIHREHMEPYSEPYDSDFPGYGEHTVDARLSADAIQAHFWIIPKPMFILRRRSPRYGFK